MAERKETPHNRVVMQPPAYLKTIEFNPKPWGHPHKNRRAELDHYEQGRNIGAVERDPELEERLRKRRDRQLQNHMRRMEVPEQPPGA